MKNLKKFRIDADMTQENLAERVNVDRATVSCWENGIAKPRVDKLLLLAKVFNCSVDDLLCEKE